MEHVNIRLNPLDIELDSYLYDEVLCLADDELSDRGEEIFFFGKLIDTNNFIGDSVINESKYYSSCPRCEQLIQHARAPKNGASIECPYCTSRGTAYDFRDPEVHIDTPESNTAHIEMIDGGFVLRLFNSRLDYSERDYDNYETLKCYPFIAIRETAREYWINGNYYYYENINDEFNTPNFIEVHEESICDSDFWIYNYDNDYDPMSSSAIEDIKFSAGTKTCIKALTRSVSHKTFSALKKYGFNCLAAQTIYAPGYFPDSDKISEILGVDYNKLKSKFDIGTICIDDLNVIKELTLYDLEQSEENLRIARSLGNKMAEILVLDRPKKIFKYIRNQMHKNRGLNPKDYFDYISECVKLEYDLKEPAVLYPTDIGVAHRRTAALVKIENDAIVEYSIQQKYEELRNAFEWSDGEYAISMPKTSDEVIEEGAVLNHCVGGYCERIANGESVILFLRRTEEADKPFYTLELKPDTTRFNLVQCRGFKNTDQSPEIRAKIDVFLGRYERWFNNRKFERYVSNVKTYFKAVKKTADGRYISAWDSKTEYKIGALTESKLCDDPDRVAVQGIHFASIEFAQKYGDTWDNVAILELEVNIHDMVIPDAKDQLRASKVKVIREVPMEEMGEWGKRHIKQSVVTAA